MTDDLEFSGRAYDEVDLDQIRWADEHLIDSDDLLLAPFDPGRSEEEHAAPDSPITLSENIWGDETGDDVPAELPFPTDPQLDGDFWLPRNDGDPDLADGPTVGAAAVTSPLVPPAPRRPILAPAPVPGGRWSGLGRQAGPRVAALALVVVATAALLVAVTVRGPDRPPDLASQRIDASAQSTSTMPPSTVSRAPSPSLTTLVTSPQPASITGDAPDPTSASPSPAVTAATTPVTTTAPRSPARSAGAPVASPTEPTPAPTPRAAPVALPPEPTPTVAPSPTIIVLPVPEPETTVTTRRPRPIVTETTVAPTTTVPKANNSPGED